MAQANLESLMLLRRGTKPCDLTARNILQAAERDMWAKGENAKRKAHRRKMKSEGLPTRGHCDPALPYAFASVHVRKAGTVAELLKLAVDDTTEGMKSDRIDTVRIYSNPDRLWSALQLSRAVSVEEAPRAMLDVGRE